MECSRGRRREWRSVNLEKAKERERESARKHRAADPERARENWRRWRAVNKDKINQRDRERKRLHYAKNKDRILGQQAAKRAANPQKAREHQRRWRAAGRGSPSGPPLSYARTGSTSGEPPPSGERRAPDRSLTEPA